MFADRGITATSLREIRLAAGQANAGAIHYHFGDREGVLKALLERELPALVGRRRQLLEGARSASDTRSVAEALIAPFAEMATGSRHERWVVQFLSRLNDDLSVSSDDVDSLIGDTGVHQAYELLRRRLPAVGDDLLRERLQLGLNSFLHAAALRARAGRGHVDDRTFGENLVDMFSAALRGDPG